MAQKIMNRTLQFALTNTSAAFVSLFNGFTRNYTGLLAVPTPPPPDRFTRNYRPFLHSLNTFPCAEYKRFFLRVLCRFPVRCRALYYSAAYSAARLFIGD
jgi:hypothetical protein